MLVVEDLHVDYGRVAAVRGVSLNVEAGEIVCLAGPNGAGKSTTLLAITGVVAASAGSIRFQGTSLAGTSIEDIACAGISLVPEGRHVFGTLTVEENLRLGAVTRKDRAQIETDLERLLQHFPVLRERFRTSAGKLSGGEQQQVAIARALMARPKLLLVDEPALGLAPQMIERAYDILLRLRREGLSLLIVEQSTERAFAAADRIYIMRNGEIVFAGRSDAEANREAVEKAYFGFELYEV
jgi:branched-chain amino acid transport system ATP-binding protein